jgi:small conductance mechanosensitive channel
MNKIPEFFEPEFWQGRIHQILGFIIILFMTVVVTRLTRIVLDKFFRKASDIINVDLSRYNIVKNLVITGVWVLGIGLAIYSIPALRTLSLSIFAGAGILAAVIGFASQKAFSNIISGIFIVIFKPFRVDDRIQVGANYSGVVEDITLRHTVIKNQENKRIVIPNSVISDETVINFTIVDEKICKLLDFPLSYNADIKKARRIIQEEAAKHPEYLDNRDQEQISRGEHPVQVKVINLGETYLTVRAWIWTRNPAASISMGYDLLEKIKDRFEEEEIEIPYYDHLLALKNFRENSDISKISIKNINI